MTQVRAMLPVRLRTARLATIARDAGLTRFFASGDDSATIRGILKGVLLRAWQCPPDASASAAADEGGKESACYSRREA